MNPTEIPQQMYIRKSQY